MTTLVHLDDIKIDAGTQVRAAINEAVVTDYYEQMGEGVEFPPVVLFHDGNHYYMADGFHRYMASQRVGYKEITADVRPGTKTDALWFALGANKANGQRLTATDKRHAILLALQTWPERSSNQLAEQVGCTQQYVQRLRTQVQVTTTCNLPDRVVGKDGKNYPASRQSSQQQQTKRDAIREMVLAGQPAGDIRRKLNAHPQAIADIRRELGLRTIDYSRAAVQARREQMREMAAAGHTSRQIAAAIGISEEGCRIVMRREGIEVPADKVTRGTHRHDSNRIVERIVADAENLTEGASLIEFADLDRAKLPEWIDILIASRRALDAFIKRLAKEKANGEAA